MSIEFLPLPEQKDLLEHFSYCALSGNLYWKKPTANRVKKGALIKSKTGNGHIQVSFKGVSYVAHRLIYKMLTGLEPVELDHKNTNGCDNRWSNIRECDRFTNLANTNIYINNNSGYKGVDFHKATNKWRARLVAFGKTYNLGYFDKAEEAAKARDALAVKLHKEFARGTTI